MHAKLVFYLTTRLLPASRFIRENCKKNKRFKIIIFLFSHYTKYNSLCVQGRLAFVRKTGCSGGKTNGTVDNKQKFSGKKGQLSKVVFFFYF